MDNPNYTPEVTPSIPMQSNGKPLKRKQYLYTASPKKTRIMSFVALGLSLLFVILIVGGAISALNAPIWDVPLFALAVGDDEMDELEDECEYLLDLIKEAQREDDEETIDDLEKRFDANIKEVKKMLENPSLNNCSKLSLGMDETEAKMAYGILKGLVVGGAAFVLLFALLAVLFLNKGWLITAYIFSIPFCLLYTGAGLLIVLTINLVAFIVVQVMVNSEYKEYKRSFAK